ncbi:MAG: glycoside hydrolase family 3 N-terminal domain-containing protein [Actinomycetota bacterium]|nr:glycoside hydrolase family 3 N-terminal domain-containing protein [Actinomycetota bacterium]
MKRTATALAAVLLIVGLIVAAGCGRAADQQDQAEVSNLERMSTEQKVGQLFMVGFEGTTVTPEIEEMFNTIHPGGVILFGRNIEGEDQLKQLLSDLQDLAQADGGLPLFVATDQEGGQICRITWLNDDTSQSEITDAGQAHDIGLERARGLKELGINLNLAPVLDIGTPGDFLTKYGRTFQGGPQDIGNLGKSVISGQSEGGILSTAKHFPGYGGIDYDPENDKVAVVDTVPEFSQFQIAAQADPAFVMTANVIYTPIDPELPFTLSPKGIEFLRRNVDGEYLVISDDLASKVLKETYTLGKTVVSAATAGVDVLLISGNQPEDPGNACKAVLDAVKNGEVDEEILDDKVSRILELKQGINP